MNEKILKEMRKNFKLHRRVKKYIQENFDDLTANEINAQLSQLITDIFIKSSGKNDSDKYKILVQSSDRGGYLYDTMREAGVDEEEIVASAMYIVFNYFMSRYPKDKFPSNPYLKSNQKECDCPKCRARRGQTKNKENSFGRNSSIPSGHPLEGLLKTLKNMPGCVGVEVIPINLQSDEDNDLPDFLKGFMKD